MEFNSYKFIRYKIIILELESGLLPDYFNIFFKNLLLTFSSKIQLSKDNFLQQFSNKNDYSGNVIKISDFSYPIEGLINDLSNKNIINIKV